MIVTVADRNEHDLMRLIVFFTDICGDVNQCDTAYELKVVASFLCIMVALLQLLERTESSWREEMRLQLLLTRCSFFRN